MIRRHKTSAQQLRLAAYELNRDLFKSEACIKKAVKWRQDNPLTPDAKKAQMQGYEPISCEDCKKFTLVRNGSTLKCNTCGSCRY